MKLFQSNNLPVINIKARTDLWGQGQLAQVVFSSTDRQQSSQYLSDFEKYIITIEQDSYASFSSKTLAIATKFYTSDKVLQVQDNLLLYGLLRYCLWYLIKGKWTLHILERKYTERFYKALLSSTYSIFYPILTSEELGVYETYFVI